MPQTETTIEHYGLNKDLTADTAGQWSDVLTSVDEDPVLISVSGEPRAVVIEINEYRSLLAKIELQEVQEALLKAEAEDEPGYTLEEFEAKMVAHRESRFAKENKR